MEYRLATQKDTPEVAAIWQQAFGDSIRSVEEKYLGVFAGQGVVHVAADEAVQAILLAVPCGVQGIKGVYLYALATLPQQQGKGVMSSLLLAAEREVFAKGAQFAALIPAQPQLYDFYQKRGYAEKLLLRQIKMPLQGEDVPSVHAAKLDGETLFSLRRRFLNLPYVDFSPRRRQFIVDDMLAEKFKCAAAATGYVVYRPCEEELLVAELAADSDAAAEQLLCGVAKATGCNKANITLPQASKLFAGRGSSLPTAAIKWLGGKTLVPELYLRFALDSPGARMQSDE